LIDSGSELTSIIDHTVSLVEEKIQEFLADVDFDQGLDNFIVKVNVSKMILSF